MSRLLRRLGAACLLAVVCGGLAVLPSTSATAAAADEPTDPLSVTIDSMSPSVLADAQQPGRVTLRGRVRNDSEEPWSDLVAYVVPGAVPIRTEGELAAAVASDPLTPFGSRLVEDGLYTRLPNLAPGQSARYRISVPIRSLGLSANQGVYWLGVHVLGTSLDGRIDGADGRARTFLPLVRTDADPAGVEVIVPFRQRVARAPDGRVLGERNWSRLLSPGGRLGNLLDLVESSPIPVSVLVDPAVLDAVESLSLGNPSFDGTPTTDPDPVAEDWLRRFLARSRFVDLLTLPYGDTDVAAALDEGQTEVLDQAKATTLDRQPVDGASPVFAPMTGFLSTGQLERLGAGHTVLLSPDAVPEADAPSLVTTAGPQVVLGDPLLSTPGVTGGAALRQVLLAHLAVRSLSGEGDVPLVWNPPPTWDPGATDAEYLQGLEVPWVRGVGLAEVRAATPGEIVDAATIVSPEGVDDSALPISNFLAVTDLTAHGEVLAALLESPDVAPVLARQSLLAGSEHARTGSQRARTLVNRATSSIDATLGKITLSGPSFVTLSSDTGTFQVTITNGLDQDVTIGILGNSGTKQLRISAPSNITIPAGQRRSVRISATAHQLGVFRVTLRAATTDGHLLPRDIVVSVRSSQVGRVLWLVFGAAGGILTLAITLRIVRRIRRRRREHG